MQRGAHPSRHQARLLSVLQWVTCVALALSFGCASARSAPEPAASGDRALLWTSYAAEYQAAAHGSFAAAAAALPRLLADAAWTAALEQGPVAAQGKPAAVVVDIDDTLLSTSSYQWQLARARQEYEAASWDTWLARQQASAVPGAVGYVKAAQALGVAVVYITNRSCRPRHSAASLASRAGGGPTGEAACPQLADTRQQLLSAGFPAPEAGQLLLRGLAPEWQSDKSSRRAHVAARYRILQLIGDDLGDFVPGAAAVSAHERELLVGKHRAFWGRAWFMLPNPMYGSWQARLPPITP
jgi:predicted secreted acid phosphatase